MRVYNGCVGHNRTETLGNPFDPTNKDLRSDTTLTAVTRERLVKDNPPSSDDRFADVIKKVIESRRVYRVITSTRSGRHRSNFEKCYSISILKVYART